MKKLFLLAFLLVPIVLNAQFIEGTEIPLMDGIQFVETDSFSFDTPAGQIMTFVATSRYSRTEIEAFYKESLIALGWKAFPNQTYRRDQDELVLQVKTENNLSYLKIQLTFFNK